MVETEAKRPGRNDPCHCGSGTKYKHCCLAEDEEADLAALAKQQAAAPLPAPPDEGHARRATLPRAQDQPWKRSGRTTPGTRRITTPRKAG
jgi:hypothetical protein